MKDRLQVTNLKRQNKMRLLYLSGAPRVSTKKGSDTFGARSHILGIIEGFEESQYNVDKYIVGDLVPESWRDKKTERKLSNSIILRIAADLLRFYSCLKHRRLAYNKFKNSVDLVYERFGAFQALGAIFQKDGVKWVLETNALLYHEASVERKSIFFVSWCKRLEINAYKKCDYLICISENLKELLVEKAGIDASKIIVIPNGVNTARFNPETVAPKRFFEPFTIGFVGLLASWCGVDVLIKSISKVKESGREIKAVIVGDGIMMKDYSALIKELNLTEDITLTGSVDWNDIPSLIAGFDVTYSGQVSLQIGKMYLSPLKIYEYMAMAKPILASGFADAKTLITDGQNGYLFKSGDEESLTETIKKTIDDINELKKGAAEKRDLIILKHSWKARVLEILGRVKSGR